MDGTRFHRVTIVVGGKQIDGWIEYQIDSSMIEPSDKFTMTRPFDIDAWRLCRLDAEVKVAIDGVVVIDGFIDGVKKNAKAGTMVLRGRDKVGRLIQESVPAVFGFDGLTLEAVLRKLVSPWFSKVTFSDARNRTVRRGKGKRAPAANEPLVLGVKGLTEDKPGHLDPGETRWRVIEVLLSQAGLLCWSSGDGRELIISKPNYSQAVQYIFCHGDTSRGPGVLDLVYETDIADSYSLIEAHGAGAGDDNDFGSNVSSYMGIARDGSLDDGTGRDFLRPKRLVLTQRGMQDNRESQRAAELEMRRRNFRRRVVEVTAPLHGQSLVGSTVTLFTPNTLARVIDTELELDASFLPFSCSYRGTRDTGETTVMQCVPRGTEFVAP